MEALLKIAICDDEKTILEEQYEIIRDVLDEKSIGYVIDTFESPQNLILSRTVYDIVILDIEMNGMNGIQTAVQIKKKNGNCLIFFVTNYESYLDDAFNTHAFRFWTKPLERHRLVRGIDAALAEIEKNRQFIIATNGVNKIKIMMQSIIYIYVVTKKVYIVTTKGEIEVSDKFEFISGQLSGNPDFFESHRGYCVNFKYINHYCKDKIYCSHQGKSYEVYLSRRKYNSFCKNFMEWMGDAK